MTIENKKDLDRKIDHYIKAKDYVTARRFAVHYKNIEGFELDQALEKIRKAEDGPQKSDKPTKTIGGG